MSFGNKTAVPVLRYEKTLLYGRGGVGKTTLAGTLAKNRNLLFFDGEGSSTALFNPAYIDPAWLENIMLVRVFDEPGGPRFSKTIRGLFKALGRNQETNICKTHGLIDCKPCRDANAEFHVPITLELIQKNDAIVVIDSISALADSFLNHINAGRPDDYKMETDDWGALSKLMGTIAQLAQGARFDMLMLSHELLASQQDGSQELLPMFGSRNSSAAVPRFFDDVIRVFFDNKKQVMRSLPSTVTKTAVKSRLGINVTSSDDLGKLFPRR